MDSPDTLPDGNVAGEVAPEGALDAGPVADHRGGLMSRSFWGLLVTQFLGAANDNLFRWLVVPIGKD
ncbi:MAG: hypothetical protein JW818_08035, partial [Pirellulales bacterium]|nr:hypothetical protein [Pirellulales bacterium]